MGDIEEEWRGIYGRGMEGEIWKRNGGGDMAKVHEIGSSSIKKCLLLGISTRFY